MKFKGDVIITDPCYFIDSEDNWQLFCKAYFGGDKQPLRQFGIEPAIIIDNEEISCEVYDDGRRLGRFCSDSAMISVCLLESVRNHNPDYDYENYNYTATVIKGFDGYIEVQKSSENDCELSIVGKGNLNFHT